MTQAQVTAFFLFDVADSIDLTSVREQNEATVTTRLRTKPAAPPYPQYQQPPVAIDGAAVGLPEINGYRVRFTAFDYGVVSVAFTRALHVSWDELLDQSISVQDNPQLNDEAERRCRPRLFNMTAARLGFDQWKANVRDKLKTLDDIYRFAVEHTSIARGEFLALTIVGLIVLEIVLLLAGIE